MSINKKPFSFSEVVIYLTLMSIPFAKLEIKHASYMM